MLFFNILYTLIVIKKNNEWQFVLFDSKKHTDETTDKRPTFYFCKTKKLFNNQILNLKQKK